MAVSVLQTSHDYSWDGGTRLAKSKADAFGKALERVKERVGSTFEAKDVVEEARPEGSPIHDLFEWDDEAAGAKYRESQARHYIRALIVVVGEEENRHPVRVAFSEGPGRGYMASEEMLASPAMRNLMVARALTEAKAWRRRYNDIKELAGVFTALDEVEAEHEVVQPHVAP